MKSKNIGIGNVYTYRIDFTKNKGQGYVAGPDYVKTRNVGIGRFPSVDTQQDPSEGLVRIDGEVRYVVPEKYASVGPQPLPVPAPMTLRFEFSQATSDPTTLGITKGTWTKLEAGDRNIWDWTYDNRNWTIVFGNKFTTTFDPDVKLIDAGDTSGVRYCDYLFNGCNSLTSVALFDISGASDLTSMFSGCSKLVVLPLFDTRNAGRTVDMLSGCSSLTTVPPFDTSKVTTMLRMFSSCSKLVSVPVFDTKNVTDMRYMFYRCTSLTEVPPFDVRNVSDMRETFRECTNVKSGALELYKQASATGKVSLHDRTFSNCGANTTTGLADLKLIPTSWGGRFVDPVLALDTTVDGTSVTISGTITNAAEDYIIDINHEQHIVTGNTFSFTYDNLSEGDYDWEVIMIGDKSGFVYQTNVQFTIESEIPEPADMTLRFAFSNASSNPNNMLMTKGTWTKVDNYPGYSNVWDWTYDNPDWSETFVELYQNGAISRFRRLSNENDIKLIDAGNIDGVTNIFKLYFDFTGLTYTSLFGFDHGTTYVSPSHPPITYVTDKLQFNNVTNFEFLFCQCRELANTPLIDTSKATNLMSMFGSCWNITTIPDFDVSSVTNMGWMFNDCYKVESGALALFNKAVRTGLVTDHFNTFTNCGRDTVSGYADLLEIPQDWGGLKVVIPEPAPMTLRFLFSNESTDPTVIQNGGTWTKIENHPDGNVWDWTCTDTSWESKFDSYYGWNLTANLDPDIRIIGAGDTSSVTNMQYMFYIGSSLTSVSLFDTSNVTNTATMFYHCDSLTSAPLFNTRSALDMSGMFEGCTSLTTAPLFDTSSVTNMNFMFNDCPNVESGALALYQQASATGRVQSHNYTFLHCGENTESGLAELQQIPSSWGGLAE